jgi:hypothetical protein
MPLGTDIVYPATLPTPQAASIQSVERRVLSSEGFFESRAGQTDRLSIEEITFPPLTPAEALIFDDWWRDDLLGGGIWFAAAWPRPEGQTSVARRFLRPPAWDYIGAPDSGYWRVTATFEVRGTGELPVLYAGPFFLLHFDGNLTDSSDNGRLFEADTIITDAAPNSFTYTTDPVFGTHAGRFPGTNNHIRSETWGDLQLASFDWTIEGFFRSRDVSGAIGGPIINTGSLQAGGNEISNAPEGGQFALGVSDMGVLNLEYSDATGSEDVPVVGSPDPVAEDVWQHFAIVSDATSLRLYSGPVPGGVSTLIAEAPGARPYAGAYDSLQRFFIGCKYTGGIPPLETYGSAGGRFHGDIDELRFVAGAAYTGSSVAIPLTPFPD